MLELFQNYVQEPLLLTACTADRPFQPTSLSPWKHDGTVVTGLLASALALCPSLSNTAAMATFLTPGQTLQRRCVRSSVPGLSAGRPRGAARADSIQTAPPRPPRSTAIFESVSLLRFSPIHSIPGMARLHTRFLSLPAHVLPLGLPLSELVGARP